MIPSSLRGFTILLWIAGAFVVVASILPGWENEDTGPISLSELWRQGIGPMVSVFGLGMILVGTVIYIGWAWVRHALMLGIVAIVLSGFVDSDYESVPVWIMIPVALIGPAIGIHYFYFRADVIEYFNGKLRKKGGG